MGNHILKVLHVETIALLVKLITDKLMDIIATMKQEFLKIHIGLPPNTRDTGFYYGLYLSQFDCMSDIELMSTNFVVEDIQTKKVKE